MYSHIGPNDIKLEALRWETTHRVLVENKSDVLASVSGQHAAQKGAAFTTTFIVDAHGLLWIADRHSEHVACARGGDVLSAGEMTFEADNGKVAVAEVTNQSTGYCPEPESWPAVAAALDRARIQHPNKFTHSFLFRRCESCGQTNIVKEGDFTCAVCGTELNQEWNFTHDTRAEQR